MRKLLLFAVLGFLIGIPTVLAAPTTNLFRNIAPETDSLYINGSSTAAWLQVTSDEFCLTADSCITSWPVGGAGGGASTTIAGLSPANGVFIFATGTATGIGLTITTTTPRTITFTPTISSGYTIPLTASTTEWSNFYTTPSGRITAGTNLSWSGNTLNGTMASSTIIAGGTATHSPSITLATTTDTNILLSINCAASTCTFNPSFTGTLAAARLNSNVVQAITNDTNITGSISAQNLTLGWTSFLSIARGGTGTSTTPSASQILLGNGTGYDYATLPSCSDPTNSKLLYNNSTRTFSCGTDQSGGGGSVSGGLTGFVTTWASSTGLTYGTLRDNGTVAGVNATSSIVTFNVQGVAGLNPFVVASSTGTALLTIGQNGSTTISSLGTGIVRATSGSLYTDTGLASSSQSFILITPSSGSTTTPYQLTKSFTVTGWNMSASNSCSASIDIWKTTDGTLPTAANRITGSAMPSLSSQQLNKSSTLTGWTTTFNVGDVVVAQASSTVTCTSLIITLEGRR